MIGGKVEVSRAGLLMVEDLQRENELLKKEIEELKAEIATLKASQR